MKTIAPLAVQAILTFETVDQDMVNANVMVPTNVDVGDLMDVELDVLEQILGQAGEQPWDQLVKISLCYTKPPRAMDPGMQKVFDYLVRMPRSAKYYFQPDQREGVEKALMVRIPMLALNTSSLFA